MADGKNTVIVYIDLIHVIEKLTDEQAGKYFKHFLRYVNDLDPVAPDDIIDLIFEPQKQQLKRDLKGWEKTREKRSLSGRLGGINSGISRSKTKQNEANEASASNLKQTKQNEANEAVTVTDTVTVNEKKEIVIGKIQKEFYNSLTPFLNEFGKEILREFYQYWSEPNKSKTKIKYQLEKTWDTHLRLLRWVKNDFGKMKTEEMKSSKKELDRLYKKV